MRLYSALLVTAVALLASNVSAGHADCDMVPVGGFESSNDSPVQQGSDVGASQATSASGSTPKDSFDGFDSSNDSPTQQGSSPDSPIEQGSATPAPTTGSDVGASQATSASGSTPKDSFDGFDSSNDSPIEQGSATPAPTTGLDVGASQDTLPDGSFDSPTQQGSSPDAPIQEGSSPDSPIQQGSAPSDASFISSYSGPTPDFPDYGQGSAPTDATPAPTTGSDVGASNQEDLPDGSFDSPVQQGSSPDAPTQQESAPSSNSQASASGDDDIKQGVVIPAGTDAPETDAPSQKTDVAGEADTQAPAATTPAPVVASNSSASGSGLTPTISTNSTSAPTTTPSNSADNSKLCAKPRVQITSVDVGAAIDNNEDEAALKVVAISAIPSGGSRVAFQSGDSVIVRELDANDKLTSTPAVKVPLHDFGDLYADDKGFVILGTRDAEGGGTANCGNPSNLCGTAPNPPTPCYDMYLVRYDGTKESWATKLTSSSASLPPYSTGKTGPDVYMIWWYAHHGRIAFDGTNWAAYFGAAISTSEGGCINIHQGDRMKVVSPSGSITASQDSFDWGCSHSGFERITYDSRKKGFATVCKTDNNNRIMPPQDWDTTIYPVDLAAADLGDIVPDSAASSNKYWATVSNGNDNAKVHLIHFDMKSKASEDIALGGTDANERAPHLASIGKGGMLAMWEGSSSSGDLQEGGDRTIYAQVLDSATGKEISGKVTVDKSVVGNRYQALKSYPDGSVAYLSKGTTGTSLQVVRFFGC